MRGKQVNADFKPTEKVIVEKVTACVKKTGRQIVQDARACKIKAQSKLLFSESVFGCAFFFALFNFDNELLYQPVIVGTPFLTHQGGFKKA